MLLEEDLTDPLRRGWWKGAMSPRGRTMAWVLSMSSTIHRIWNGIEVGYESSNLCVSGSEVPKICVRRGSECIRSFAVPVALLAPSTRSRYHLHPLRHCRFYIHGILRTSCPTLWDGTADITKCQTYLAAHQRPSRRSQTLEHAQRHKLPSYLSPVAHQ